MILERYFDGQLEQALWSISKYFLTLEVEGGIAGANLVAGRQVDCGCSGCLYCWLFSLCRCDFLDFGQYKLDRRFNGQLGERYDFSKNAGFEILATGVLGLPLHPNHVGHDWAGCIYLYIVKPKVDELHAGAKGWGIVGCPDIFVLFEQIAIG